MKKKYIVGKFFIFEDAAGLRYVQSSDPLPKGLFKDFTLSKAGEYQLIVERKPKK